MAKLQEFLKKYKKECIALFIFVVCLGVFSFSYAFAAVEPVRSIVIQSENTDFASGEEGSWQVTKSGYWTGYGEAEVTLDVDTSLMTNNQYTDIIFVLDISGSMAGEKLDRVKSDSKELISSLLSNQNNRAALITFDTSSQIVSELTNDEELLSNEIDNLQVTGSTNYYQALVNVDSILQNYQKESGREMIVLFLTDGYPNVDTPNEKVQYQYLKSKYPYITINGIQYEMGSSILNPIKEISDNQFIADMETLNNVLFDASVSPVTYDTYQIIDYIDNENFSLENKDDIKVTTGKVELAEENGKQKIIWTLDNLASGREANLTMKLKLKDELVGQGGIYPTNESTEVISKIEEQEEDVSTTNTPILADNYKVIYDGNAPDGSTVTNVPSNASYSVFSTIEISNQVPSCVGYEFKGWSIATDGVTRVGEDYFIMPESDVIIKAEWSKVGITKSMNGTVNTMGDPIMKSYTSFSNIDYHSSTYKSKITSIVTKDNIEIPSTAIESWDVSAAGDGSVIAYIEDDGRGTGTYKVTIGAQGNIIANSDSSNLFYEFENVESIDLTYLDTSQVTDMSDMFEKCFSLTNLDLSNFDTSQVTDMSSMFDDCSSLISLDLSNFDTSKVTDMSFMFVRCSSLVSLNVSNFDTSKVTNMSVMFNSCDNLTSLDLSRFNTSKVTDMSSMFTGCDNLISLNISSFDTSQVKDMNNMFAWCNNLTNLDVSSFNTSQVTDMSFMFQQDVALQNLNLSNFDTSQVTDMSYMFDRCRSLLNLNVSNFDTSQVTNMSYMFYECSVLSNLYVSNFNTSQVTDMSYMFSICDSLTSLDLSSFDTNQVRDMSDMFSGCNQLKNIIFGEDWNTSQVTDMNDMFYYCSSLTSLDLSDFDTSRVTDMGYMFSGCSSLLSLDLSSFNTPNVTNISGIFSSCSSITNIMFGPGWTNEKITDMSSMFNNLSNLSNIDFNGFKTTNVTDMNGMFYGCSSLTDLNLSSFDTSQVTDMGGSTRINSSTTTTSTVVHGMFEKCINLKQINFGDSFNTANVLNMDSMFRDCSSLLSLDLSFFDISKVTDMSLMFGNCTSLQQLNIESFKSNDVNDMAGMFFECENVISLNLDEFETVQATNMAQMFANCSSLTSLNLSNFDTSQVTDMGLMFSECESLTELDLSNFDTRQVTTMYRMFEHCSNLTSLNLGSFDTIQVTNMVNMFYRCSSLTNLDMSNAVFNATSYSYMFGSVPNGIAIIVKDTTAKTWIEARLSDVGRTGTVTIAGA